MTILIAIATLLLCAPNPTANYLIAALEFGSQSQPSQEIADDSKHQEFLVSVVGNEQTPIANNHTSDANCVSTDTLYRWYLIATIIGVAGGFAGLWIIRSQTIATRDAANAAKASADSVKNIERPWLLVSGVEQIPVLLRKSGVYVIGVRWTVKNYGKTPALVDKIESRIDIVPSDYKFPVLPIYGEPHTPFKKPIVPPGEDSHRVVSILNRGWNESGVADEYRQLIKDELMIFVCGRVAYKDPFGEPHETRFCLKIDMNDGTNSEIGPDGYNTCK